MAITLDATVGGTSSNSYVTEARAGELIETLPHAGDWFTEVYVDKKPLLIHATRLIDRYGEYHGYKTSSSQALAFPRAGVVSWPEGNLIANNVIPAAVEIATVEWAYHLLHNADVEGGGLGEGLDSIRTPSFALSFSGGAQQPPFIPGVIRQLLRPLAFRIGLSPARVLRT